MKALEATARTATDAQQALADLRARTSSPIEALKALVRGRGMTLADAKQALFQSDAWRTEAEQMIENEQVMYEVFRRLADERQDL